MRTIEEIRSDNLLRLQAEGVTQADLAHAMNKSRQQVSQWFGKGSARAMSSATARELEAAIGRPRGWMDNLPSQPARPDLKILATAIAVAMDSKGGLTPENVASAYEFLVERAAAAPARKLPSAPEPSRGPHGTVTGGNSGTVADTGRTNRTKKARKA